MKTLKEVVTGFTDPHLVLFQAPVNGSASQVKFCRVDSYDEFDAMVTWWDPVKQDWGPQTGALALGLNEESGVLKLRAYFDGEEQFFDAVTKHPQWRKELMPVDKTPTA